MKILVGKVYEGERRLTVLPRHGAHMAPVQLRGRDALALQEELLAVIVAVADRERAPAPAVL